MNRNDIIRSLTHCSEADRDRLSDRLQQCNVRIVRTDGSVELSNDQPRGPTMAATMMQDDPTIAYFQYNLNGEWQIAC